MLPRLLVLVRHATSVCNEEAMLIDAGKQVDFSYKLINTPDQEIQLSLRGISEAKRTGEYLKNNFPTFQKVYCSPYSRAIETMENFNLFINSSKIIYDWRLREKQFGHWLHSNAVMAQLYPAEVARKEKEGRCLFRAYPDGENYHDVDARIADFWQELIRKNDQENLLIVSHSGALMSLVKLIDNHDENWILNWSANAVANTSLTVYENVNGQLQLKQYGLKV